MAVQEHRMELALEMGSTLGEGIGWHEGRWWWTDIQESKLHSWAANEAAPRTSPLPDRLGSFAHTRSGGILMGLAKQISLASRPDASGVIASHKPLADVETGVEGNRINDGRTDRRGYFVFGTIHDVPVRKPTASIYQFSMQHGLRRLALPRLTIANSICFSPDGRTMYFADTVTRRIQQADYDAETAQLGNIRSFVEVTTPHGWPDGSVIDRDGCLWNAQWGAGCVTQYSPDGDILCTVRLAGKHSSCPAFGGEHGDELMVTTARQELTAEDLAAWPLSGSLFRLKMPRPLALADALFDDEAV